jgi:HEAT repeat protein
MAPALFAQTPESTGGDNPPDVIAGKNISQWIRELKSADPGVRENAVRTIPMFGSAARPAAAEVINMLANDLDVSLRVNSAYCLMQMDVPKAQVPAAVRALARRMTEDNQSIARFYAALALGKFGHAAGEVLPSLILGSRDARSWEIRKAAVTSLAAVAADAKEPDARAIDALLTACKDVAFKVRLEAVMGLGDLPPVGEKHQAALVSTLKSLTGDREKTVAAWAYAALVIHDRAPADHLGQLVQMLSDDDLPARLSAVRALGTVGALARPKVADLVPLLKDAEPAIAATAAWAVGEACVGVDPGPAALSTLSNLAKQKDGHPIVKEAAQEALERIRGKKEPGKEPPAAFTDAGAGRSASQWIRDLKHPDPSMRENALRTLPLMGRAARPAVKDVINILANDRDISPRTHAALCLMQMDVDEDDVPAVIAALARRLSPRVDNQAIMGYFAATALSKFGNKAADAIPDLITASRDPRTWEIRKAAVGALFRATANVKEGPDPRGVPTLITSSRDAAGKVRLEAVVGMGAMGIPPGENNKLAVIKALKDAVNDRDKTVAVWAYVGLMTYDSKVIDTYMGPLARFLTSSDVATRGHAARALGAMGAEAKAKIPELVSALKDRETAVAATAAWALGEIATGVDPGPTALSALTDLATRKDVDSYVQGMAQDALDKIKGKKVAPKPPK